MRARYTFSIALVILSLGLGVSIAAGARAGAFVAVLIAVLHPVVLALPSAFIQAGRKLARIRRNFNLSYALWLLLFLSGLVFRTRDTQTIKDSPLDAWAAFRIVCVAVAGTLAVQSVAWDSRSIRWLVRGLPAILVIFGLLCTASVVWSANPGWTLYRSLEYLVDVAVLVRIVSGVNMAERYKDYFDWTWVLLFGLLSSVWLGAVLWPDEALEKGVGVIGIQLSGVFPSLSANGVGELGGLLGLISLARAIYSPQKAFYLLVFGGCSATLIFSQTRSALAGFLCGFAFILIGIRRFRVAALVAGLVAVLFTGASDTLWAYVLRGQDSEMFTSLSGRADWWAVAVDKFRQRPMLGYGAYSGGRFVVLEDFVEKQATSVHNDYLEVLVGTGAIGLIVAVIALLAVWSQVVRFVATRAHSELERQLSVEALAVLAFLTTRSMFSVVFFWHPPLPFLLIVGYAEVLRRRRRMRVIGPQFSSRPGLQPSLMGTWG